MMNDSMLGGYGMIFGMGLMLFVWVGIFYLVYRLFKIVFRKNKVTQQEMSNDALNDTEGEINNDDYKNNGQQNKTQ